jgi:hypothetical protein
MLTISLMHNTFDGDQATVHQRGHFGCDFAWNVSYLRPGDILDLYRISGLMGPLVNG